MRLRAHVVGIVTTAAILLASCGELPAVDLADAASADSVDFGAQVASGGSPGGSLPVGYFARQCQWDACGGPLAAPPMIDPEDR